MKNSQIVHRPGSARQPEARVGVYKLKLLELPPWTDAVSFQTTQAQGKAMKRNSDEQNRRKSRRVLLCPSIQSHRLHYWAGCSDNLVVSVLWGGGGEVWVLRGGGVNPLERVEAFRAQKRGREKRSEGCSVLRGGSSYLEQRPLHHYPCITPTFVNDKVLVNLLLVTSYPVVIISEVITTIISIIITIVIIALSTITGLVLWPMLLWSSLSV